MCMLHNAQLHSFMQIAAQGVCNIYQNQERYIKLLHQGAEAVEHQELFRILGLISVLYLLGEV